MDKNYNLLCFVLEHQSNIEIGDTILVGRFKNRTAIITGFTKDKNNQPQVETTRGVYSLHRFRIKKLMPEKGKSKNENSRLYSRRSFILLPR